MVTPMDVWTRLTRALGDQPRETLEPPQGGRLAAVLVLLADTGRSGDPEVVYTRRRDDLATHPGQISFPGGRVDAGETVEQAALREAEEEVGLDRSSVELLGRLPAFYIPPSRFWVQPIVARWRAPHPLQPGEAEVAAVLRLPMSVLRDAAAWRVVRLPTVAHSWAWQLDDRNLLWGATALVTAALLGMIDPQWHGGADPATFGGEKEVRPWETPTRATPFGGPALLWGVAERSVTAVGVRDPAGESPQASAVAAGGEAVAAAVARLGERTGSGRVLVLAGGGGTGAVGLDAARRLRDAGRDVYVVLDRPPERLGPLAASGRDPVADVTGVFDGGLPDAHVVVDALVGTGLAGPLSGSALEMVLALRLHDVPVLAVDLPSGLDPTRGLVGECVPADVTVALGGPPPGVLQPGMGPFVGDLYVAGMTGAGDPLVRLVPDIAPGRGRP